jgi:DNA uptake protein ComE-like DNA-binding protein
MEPSLFDHLSAYIRIGEDYAFQENYHPTGKVGRARFELNSADSARLLSIYGIGPVFARRIILYREALGGFHSPEQLFEVYGLNQQQYIEINRCTYIDTCWLRKLDINREGIEELAGHPYIDGYQSRAIVAYRDMMGEYKSPDEILENRLLPDSAYARLLPYLYASRKTPVR